MTPTPRWPPLMSALAVAASLAACGAGTTGPAGGPPLVGDPPLTGVWNAVGTTGADFCGVDSSCGFRLQLANGAITGTYDDTIIPTGGHSSQPLTGTYAPPAVHLAWGIGSVSFQFDGNLQGDTLLVGTVTPPNASLAFAVQLHRTH